jgi:hypothetical protein
VSELVRAAEVAGEVAERLVGDGPVAAGSLRSPVQSSLLGAAVLVARAAEGRPAFADAARAYLDAAVARLPAPRNNLCAGTLGATATALVMHRMTGDARLVPTIRAGISWVSGRARGVAERYGAHRPAGPGGLRVGDYDAIGGMAALGRVLLMAQRDGHPGAEPGLLVALRMLTDLLTDRGGDLPGWWCDQQEVSPFAPADPSGAALTGAAHGVAGPLAFLAAALRRGAAVDGQRDAVRAGAGWLLHWRHPAGSGWPVGVSGDRLRGGAAADGPAPMLRQWCTGNAGIGRALHLAGLALADSTLATAGVDVLAGCGFPTPGPNLAEPFLCHGAAGVLAAALAACRDSPDTRLAAVADTAAATVLAGWRPETPLGFPPVVIGPAGATAEATVTDSGGMLYGAPGAALALYDYARGATSPWPALLMLR